MKLLGNIIWLIFGGLITALTWCVAGLVLCITVIGIPLGKQCFKFAKLSLAPFGKKVKLHYSKHMIGNTLWLIFVGVAMFMEYIAAGVICCITIIGIPVGLQAFKFSKLALAPFGAKVN